MRISQTYNRDDIATGIRVSQIEDVLVEKGWPIPEPKYLSVLAELVSLSEQAAQKQWKQLPPSELKDIWVWPIASEDTQLLDAVKGRSACAPSAHADAGRLFDELEAIGPPDEIARGAMTALRQLQTRYEWRARNEHCT